MVKVNTYRVRQGNPMPLLCDGDTSYGLVITFFGEERQEVNSCDADTEVLKSEDMCLRGGEYYSASYQAHQSRIDCDQMVFKSVTTKPPILLSNEGLDTRETPPGVDIDFLD